eukprot:CAMPEP_0119328718 /NCGR_PEP_ID=MMETSP1333-20130426/74079_1 /TAXON_ID=418940 /ORGANISM="Scyphosphaera apsteinii, Strain RCC1455" /LENGTH=55 /DNA_ID=CAMNT_0007337657 /DNA_START=147 /DNA_END=314 /DNA_ORIENTATION=-
MPHNYVHSNRSFRGAAGPFATVPEVNHGPIITVASMTTIEARARADEPINSTLPT